MAVGSAFARTPVEIWEVILDEVIRPGVALDTTCTLESFREFRRRGGDGYTASEKQRLVLRRVCKRWQQFAEDRAHRRLDARSPLGLLPPSAGLNATRVHYATEQFEKCLTRNTRWKIVCVDITDKEPDLLRQFAENADFHPHIRRLVLDLQNRKSKLVPIADLSCFRQLTYLVIRRHNDPSTIFWGALSSPITLPHLEVLDFQCTGDRTRFPSASVHLPALRHLALWVTDSAHLMDTIEPYTSTLRSLMVRYSCKDGFIPPELFSRLANLEELAIKGWVDADGHPPSNHPLKRFIILSRTLCFIEMRSLIEHLRPMRLIFSKLEWPTSTQKGQVPQIDNLPKRDVGSRERARHEGMKELAALCESKGIRLEDDHGRTLAEAEMTDGTKADDTPMRNDTA